MNHTTASPQTLSLAPYDPARSLGVREAAQLLRGRGNRLGVSHEAVRRWCRVGSNCRGETVVLPSARIGQELRIMPEWIEWFELRRAEKGMRTAPVLARPARSRRAAHRRADERLRLAGM